ncbi:MAG: sulfatase [Planctomycetota bacterium]
MPPRPAALLLAFAVAAAGCRDAAEDGVRAPGALVKLAALPAAEIVAAVEARAPGTLLLAEDFAGGAAEWRACADTEDLLRPAAGELAVAPLAGGERGVSLSGRLGSLARVVAAEPGGYYELSGRVRTRGLAPAEPERFFGGALYLGELAARGPFETLFAGGLSTVLLASHELPRATGDTPWTAHHLVIRAGPRTQALLLGCVLSSPGPITAGAADFADLALRRVDRAAYWDDLLARGVRARQPGDPPPADWRGERLVRASLGAEARPAIVAPPGERIRFRLPLPAGEPRFRTGVGAWTDALDAPAEGGPAAAELAFEVRVEGEVVHREVVAVPRRPLDARWREIEVGLGRWAGREVALELAVAGEMPGVWGAPAVRDAAARPRRPNVILVSIDTLRADHVGCYGYGRDTTPRLDALAAAGVRFADCTAQAPYTLPSHVSLFSGQFPSVHGVQEPGQAIAAARTPMLAEILGEHGYATQAFTGGGYVSPAFGFARGFDGYANVDPFRHASSPHLETMLKAQPDLISRELFAEYGPERIANWIAAHAGEQFFLFLHTYAVHDFDPPPGYVERFPEPIESTLADFFPYFDYRYIREHGIRPEDLAWIVRHYDAAILAVDEILGGLFDHLAAFGLRERTIVVVTSDHGKELTERGIIAHGVTLYEELTRVPLVVYVPGVAPRVVETPAMAIDVAPLILAALGLPADPRMQGFDLLRAKPPERAIWSEVSDTLAHKFALRDGAGWKIIHGPDDRAVLFANETPWELYDLSADPGERTNRWAPDEPRARRLAATVQELRTRYEEIGRALGERGAGEMDAVTLGQLHQLGYL